MKLIQILLLFFLSSSYAQSTFASNAKTLHSAHSDANKSSKETKSDEEWTTEDFPDYKKTPSLLTAPTPLRPEQKNEWLTANKTKFAFTDKRTEPCLLKKKYNQQTQLK